MTPAGLPTPNGPLRYSFERAVPRTAGLPRRLVAVLLDFVLVAALSWLLAALLLAVGYIPVLALQGPEVAQDQLVPLIWLILLLELPLNLAYFTVLEGTTGRTPGKRLMDLEVLHVDGHPIGVFDAFVRTLLRFLWVTPGIGQLFMLLDAALVHATEMEQRIGDLAADTVVARAD